MESLCALRKSFRSWSLLASYKNMDVTSLIISIRLLSMGVLNAQFQNFKVVKHSNLNRKSNPSDSHWVPLISALHTYYIKILHFTHRWRRQTCLCQVGAAVGRRGDVYYFGPWCSKKFRTYPEITRVSGDMMFKFVRNAPRFNINILQFDSPGDNNYYKLMHRVNSHIQFGEINVTV